MIRFLLCAALLAAPLAAQESRASLSGRVLDPSNAVIAEAKVVATNQQTGVAAQAVTNDSGAFLIPFLLPGKYKVTAERTGFKSYSSEIELRVNDTVELTLRMEVGSITETVDVRGATPLLETANSSVGQVIDERRLLELPQRGGNPLELERLSPGVVNLTTLRIMKPASPDGTSSISANGSGNQQAQ
jgi:hypothetical protein